MAKNSTKLYLIILTILLGIFIGVPPEVAGNGEGEPPFFKFVSANQYYNITYEFNFPLQPIPKFFVFNFSTNINTTLNLDFNNTYYPFLTNRQVSIQIKNNESEKQLDINISAIFDAEKFLDELPDNPSYEDIILGFQYNSFYKIRTNITISNLSFIFFKNSDYGFSDDKYSIGYYKGQINDNLELLSTSENENEIDYIEGYIENLEGNTDYYFSVFQVEEAPVVPPNYNWLWILIPIAIAFIALIIVMTKKEYFQHLKKRTIPIDKGVHRLDMEEVLENENRSKIIELILEHPGIHFNELLRETDLAPGNLVWHLDILETYKVIKKKRVGNYVMYIPYYNKNPLSNIDLKLQKSELTLQILKAIEEHPGIWNSKLRDDMEIHRKTIQYHIDKLIDLGLVYKRKEGSKKKIYPNLESEYYDEKIIKD